MKIQREELQKKLRACRPGVELNNVALDGMDCFIFKNQRLYTYNGYVSVSVPIDYPFECVISASEFEKLIGAFRGKEVDIEAGESSLTLTCGKASASIKFMSESIYKQILIITPKEPQWKPIPEGFAEQLSRCYITNMEMGASDKVDGIFIDKDGIFSTDRVVVNYAKLYEHMDRIWLTSKVVKDLLKFDNIESYTLQDSWAIFKCGEMMFACRKYMDDLYPIDTIRKVVSAQQTNGMSGTLPNEFSQAVSNCLIFGKEKEGHVFINLEFQNDGIRVFSDTAKGNYSEFVPCAVEDWIHCTLTVEGRRLKQAFKHAGDFTFYIGYVDGVPTSFIVRCAEWTELFFTLKE